MRLRRIKLTLAKRILRLEISLKACLMFSQHVQSMQTQHRRRFKPIVASSKCTSLFVLPPANDDSVAMSRARGIVAHSNANCNLFHVAFGERDVWPDRIQIFNRSAVGAGHVSIWFYVSVAARLEAFEIILKCDWSPFFRRLIQCGFFCGDDWTAKWWALVFAMAIVFCLS